MPLEGYNFKAAAAAYANPKREQSTKVHTRTFAGAYQYKTGQDFKRLDEYGDSDAIDDWSNIGDTVLRLSHSADKNDLGIAAQYLNDYEPQLRDYYKTLRGETFDSISKRAGDPASPGGLVGKSVNSAMNFVNYFDQASQAIKHTVAGVREGDFKYAGSSLWQGLLNTIPGEQKRLGESNLETRKRTLPDGTTEYLGFEGKPIDDLRSAMGKDPNELGGVMGVLGDIADVGATIVFDPWTWVGIGVIGRVGGRAARPIMEAIDAAGHQALLKTITRYGSKKVLSNAIKEAGEDAAGAVLKSAAKGAASAARKADGPAIRQLKDLGAVLQTEGKKAAASKVRGGAFRGKIAKTIRRQPTEVTEKLITQETARIGATLARSGRRGIQFGGKTVIPSGPLGEAGTRLSTAIRFSKGGTFIRGHFSVLSIIDNMFGRAAYQGTRAGAAKGRAVGERAGAAFRVQFLKPERQILRKLYKGNISVRKEAFENDLSTVLKSVRAGKKWTPKQIENSPIPDRVIKYGRELKTWMNRNLGEDVTPIALDLRATRSLDDALRGIGPGAEEGKGLQKLMKTWMPEGRTAQEVATGTGKGKPGVLNPLLGEHGGIDKQALRMVENRGMGRQLSRTEVGTAGGISHMEAPHANVVLEREMEKAMPGLYKSLGLDTTPLFVEDTVTAAAAAAVNLHRRMTMEGMFRSLMENKVRGEAGSMLAHKPLVIASTSKKGLDDIAKGFDSLAYTESLRLMDGTYIRFPRELQKGMEATSRLLRGGDELGTFKRGLQQVNALFAGTATVPLLMGTGFHGRNALGNVFNGFLGGIRDPSVYQQAYRAQRAMQRVRTTMGDLNITWDEAVTMNTKQSIRGTVVREGFLDNEQAGLIRNIYDDIGPGKAFDITHEDTLLQRKLKGEGTDSRLVRQFTKYAKPSSKHPIIETGGTFGSAIENNGRYGLYIDQLNKGASREQARKHTMEFLFDYGELTATEHGIRDYTSRFYTFMRKNTAVQARILATEPGKIMNATRIIKLMGDVVLGEGGEGPMEGTYLPRWQKNMLGGIRHFNGTHMFGIEDTFTAATEAVTQAISAAAILPYVTETMDSLTDGKFSKDIVAGTRIERAREALGLLAGPLPNFALYMAEQSTNVSTFNGMPIKSQAGGDFGQVRRLLDVIAPMYRQLEGVIQVGDAEGFKLGLGSLPQAAADLWNLDEDDLPPGIDKTDMWMLELSNTVFGIDNVDLGSIEAQITQAGRVRGELNSLIDNLRLDGHDVPTWEDLEEEGITKEVFGFARWSLMRTADRAAADKWLDGQVSGDVKDFYRRRGLDMDSMMDTIDNAAVEEGDTWDEVVEKAILAADEYIDTLELAGITVDAATRQEAIQMALGPRMGVLEEMGIEPIHTDRGNFFLQEAGEEESTWDRDIREAPLYMQVMAEYTGMSPAEIIEIHPALGEAEALWQDAQEVGMSWQEFFEVAKDKILTKEVRYHMFGEVGDLSPAEFDYEDAEYAAGRAEQRLIDWDFLFSSNYVDYDRKEMADLLWREAHFAELTIGEQKATLGYREPTAKSRESRSDAQIARDGQLHSIIISETQAGRDPLVHPLIAALQRN